MKQLFFTALFLVAANLLYAQTGAVTLYGYRQQVTGGAQKGGDIDESGKVIKQTPSQLFQYAIYLTSTSKKKIYPVQMWIDGKPYSVKAEAQTTTQLLQENARLHSEKKITVSTTADGAIWKLTPVPLIADKSSGRAKTLAGKNALVVLYKSGSELQYGILKKFTDLSPLVRQ